MIFKKIDTAEAPKAFGPYSQGIVVSQSATLLFLSGMLPLDPSGKMIDGNIRQLTRQVIVNLEAVLRAGNSSLHQVVRTEVFLIDLKNDFEGMNEEYAIWFTGQVAPARQTIQVAALPRGSRIEISCIALGNQ